MARAKNGPLRPTETSLIIQAQIEGLSPQQVMLRDAVLSMDVGMTTSDSAKFVRSLQPGVAGLWMDRIRRSEDPKLALAELIDAQVDFETAVQTA